MATRKTLESFIMAGEEDEYKTKSRVHCPVVLPRNPKLVRGEPEEEKQAPSAFLAEMQLTTEEKLKLTSEVRIPKIIELLDMSETTHQKFTSLQIDEPMFQPFPSDIVFQNFEPYETYQVPLRLRNNDKVARLINVTQTDSPYFKVMSPADVGHKVAPGMDKVFMIQFTADQKNDYFHEVICVTEREKFLIPVKAIGGRAVIDFPDAVNFGSCPVKDLTTKTLFVRNIGKREAKFSLITESPFSVTPDEGSLSVGESMQIHVEFKALKTGDYENNMILRYDTGENVYITLYGAAVDVNVRLDKNTLKLENTFISCTSQRTAILHNRSEHIVNFRWTRFATLTEEMQHKERCKMDVRREEDLEKDAFFMECAQDVTIRDQLSILQRSFQTKNQDVDGNKLPYKDDVIEVEPCEGVIWPNSSMEIDIAFTPLEAQSYARTVYCDVTGRESRLPLRIRGEGVGPRVVFSLDSLDIGNIFVNSKHSYEVVLVNKGDIDALFSYIQSGSMFGPLFTFSPSQGIVRPGGYQAIKIDFCSAFLGNMDEDFFWAVDGSPEKLVFNIQGNVIGPTFHFNVPRLDFGVVSYGFPNTKQCSLINTSLIPMTFTLKVPADEIEENYNGKIGNDSETQSTRQREFEITPFSATLSPQSTQDIQIDLVSTTVKKYDVSLVVDVEGVGDEIASLPVIAKCIVPAISLLTPVLDFGKCFLDHPYELTIELMNDSDLPAKYELIAQVPENRSRVLFSSPEPKGILHPRTITKVPLQIIAEKVEESYTVANIWIHGSSEPPLQVEIRCFGEGPVVHVSPLEIDWGNIPVLANVERFLLLSNESLISANFSCSMVRSKSSFTLQPSNGVIPPEQDIQLTITANVDDCVRFQDKVLVNIGDTQVHSIGLTAYGMGTTIVADPPMMPTVNFGPQFSHRSCCKWFTLTNNGRRSQQLYWMTEGFTNYKAKKSKERRNNDEKTSLDIISSPSFAGPVFKLTPERLSLDPGQSQKIKLEGIAMRPQIVKEKMICHSIIGNSIGKEMIMRVSVRAEFISPLVNFSEKKIDFCILKYPGSKLEKETKQLMMKNVSSLPLNLVLHLQYPFQFILDDSGWESQNLDASEITLDVNKGVPVLIEFDPAFENNAFSRTVRSQLTVTYKEHPQEDFLELSGGVYYPNLTFETDEVDFGCILNDTEVTRYVAVTNNSPMEVKYQWSFIDSDVRIERIVHQNETMPAVSDEEKMPKEFTDEEFCDVEISFPDERGEEEEENTTDNVQVKSYFTSSDLGIQEVFDILPLYCTLRPNESQKVLFTFYGHPGVHAKAMARCSVHGGPNYDLMLTGSASLASYAFDRKCVDYGKQLYDQMAVSVITLYNSSQVGLDFVSLNENGGDEKQPGKILVIPSKAHVKALEQQRITIKYLPGVPAKFEKSFMIRVGHFEPEEIKLSGEGVFPRVVLDLPRDTENTRFKEFLETAKGNVAKVEDTSKESERESDMVVEVTEDGSVEMDEFLEVERLQVINFALQSQNAVKNTTSINDGRSRKNTSKKTKLRPQLTDYVVDFGYVVCETVREFVFQATNCGYFPVSFMADKQALYNSGFTLYLDRVKNLPGYPEPESVGISVTFDPNSANVPQGPVNIRIPINIANGPTIGIILKAIVAMPDMVLSTSSLEFGLVQCGHCKVMTILLFNNQPVSCQWSSEPTEDKKKKVDKLTPLHLRKKIKAEIPKPKHFEIMPPSGNLFPGQRINVQVKFMPTEESTYNQRLKIHIAQSTIKHVIAVRGEGSEPKVEFTSSVLEFGPVLPHSPGDEKELTVQNPSSFPVEIYSLEFDKQYLEEEKVLRSMKGYDECNTILLPPRNAGDQLSTELTGHFYEQQKMKEESEKKRVEAVAKMFDEELKKVQTENGTSPVSDRSHSAPEEEPPDEAVILQQETDLNKDVAEKKDVGELEITPVSAAIANYLGIDLSPEGRAARNRRGISIVIHGAPCSGKTPTAAALAKIYNAAVLSVDGVVTEAIQQGTTTASLRVRDLCAASAKAVKDAEEGKELGMGGTLSVEAVAAHTAQTSAQVGLQGTASTIGVQGGTARDARRTTNYFGPKGSQVSKNQPPVLPSPPASPPSAAEPPRRLSVSASVAGEDGMYSCALPEDLLVELLAERMQATDCHLGIVIDGLDSIFTKNAQTTACCILRALNNRKYIFFATFTLEHARLKRIDEEKRAELIKMEKEKEEAEKKWLEEMSEDEYDALSEQEKNELDRKRLNQKKERMKKEIEEKLERERKEREELALLEEKRLEEERDKKGRRRTVQQTSQMRKSHPDSREKENKKEKSSDKSSGTRSVAQFAVHDHPNIRGQGAPSVISERSDSCDLQGEERKRMSVVKIPKIRQPSAHLGQLVISVDDKPSEEDDKDKELLKKFQRFDSSLRDVSTLLENWDRSTGNIIRVDTPKSETEPEVTQTGSNKKMRDKKGDKEKEKEKALKESVASPRDSFVSQGKEEVKNVNKDGIGVSHAVFETTEPGVSQKDKLLSLTTLPSPDEILDGLGLGPNGPPIPPPATFAVVPYPVRRYSPFASDTSLHYLFVASTPNDPNVFVEEKPKKPEPEIEKAESRTEKEHSSRGKGAATRLGRDKEDRESGSKSKRDRQSSGKAPRRGSINTASPPPQMAGEDGRSSGDTAPAVNAVLTTHRWVVPANGSSLLRVRFKSEELGQFDQTLNFEIVGTRRRYQIFCRGVCAFPTISREPRIVFKHRRKLRKREEIVHKKFILNSETFVFGPLLCGKTRERYKEGKYPENMETIIISNTSPLPAEVSFCFQNDNNGTTFLLDPPNMSLKCGENDVLTLWAYPKTSGSFDDVLVCCVRENPEPVMFKLSCHGVRPELELDRKQLPFDRVLLHRKDTRTVFLRNSTLLPVAWRLNGLENLGDDFSVVTDHGVIESRSEYGLQVHFRAARPITVKKIIRLEVSDVDQIMGLVQAENIQVIGEAYDVALDMSFPKGADGGLDFGVLKVFDENKQSMSLKNKGRYEINFNFVFDTSKNANIADLLTVVPQKGALIPTERPTQVSVMFKSRGEITIKDETMLKCQIVEPHLGDSGEVIASIPVKVTVRSVHSKYSIFPVSDINFGASLVNTKKSRSFTIENKGEFDFRYTILKMINTVGYGRQKPVGPPVKKTKSRDGSSSGRSQQQIQQQQQQHHQPSLSLGVSNRPKRADSVKGSEFFTAGTANIRQQIGMFTIYPAVGVIPSLSSMQIAVDMMGEATCYAEEELAIDISDRPPNDHPHGIPYKLIGEAAIPGISVISPEYIGTIFEEHRVVQSLSRFQYHCTDLDSGTGVYGEYENKFMFFNAIVGRKSQARFKISNPNKISCDIVISVKPTSNKPSAKWHDVYEVQPTRACIGSYGHVYAAVTFTPPAMQGYSAIFEAAVDGMPGVVSRYRNLSFDIQGDGNLPRVTVQRPSIRNKTGNLVMMFKCLLVGRAQVLPLVLINDGTLDAEVKMTLTDPENSFTIVSSNTIQEGGSRDGTPVKTTEQNALSFCLPTGRTTEFAVQFKPTLTSKLVGEVRLSVRDNPYEETLVQLMGESYKEDVTIDNITPNSEEQNSITQLVGDPVGVNQINFGDCSVGVAKKVTFTFTNHLDLDPIRFSWTPPDGMIFSPCTGHLLPKCAKDISVMFTSDKPVTLDHVLVNCRVVKIKLAEDGNKAIDWDDRMRTVKWIDVNQPTRTTTREEGLSSGGKKATLDTVRERPTKKKVYETEPEPAHTTLDESARTLVLDVSAKVDYAACKCVRDSIHFKDTLMFQTRVFSFDFSNTSTVGLDYSVEVLDAPSRPSEDSAKEPLIRTSSGTSQQVQDASMLCPRPATAMSVVYETGSVSSLHAGPDSLPFSVEPTHGSVAAGESVTITARFAPCDITDYEGRLKFTVPNLHPEATAPVISLKGRSLLPYCHFELEDSDYITGGRRNPELPGPGGAPPGARLSPNTKVIEFQSCGVKVKVSKQFFIINPTDMDINFVWSREDSSDARVSHADLVCSPVSGMIESGKKTLVTFEYTSENLELTESFWRFFIQEHNISVPFLLVGHTTEPAVSLDRSHLNFREILIGYPAEQTVYLVNEEEKSFHFSFDKGSCHAEAHAAKLLVEPMVGVISPKFRLPVRLRFTPAAQKEINFNLVCKVKKKTLPLTLNVKAEGYAMESSLFCEDSSGNKVELTSSGANRIQFGEVEINEKAVRQLFIINSGKFNFDFTWNLIHNAKIKKKSDNPLVAISPENGTVACNTRKRCQLTFCPPVKYTLQNCSLALKITNGLYYNIDVAGCGIRPSLKLSFQRYDFGPCFLYVSRAGISPQKNTLFITNEDSKDTSVHCLYEDTPHLHVQAPPSVLTPGECTEVTFLFYPRECTYYHEVIPFEINGLSRMSVEISGQGTEIKVDVSNPADRKVNFGALRVGQSAERVVKLRNSSAAPITFILAITPSLLLLQQALTVTPSSEITLQPNGGSCNVHVAFSPTTRIPQFTEEVMLECAGLCQTVFLVSGMCQGVDIKLDCSSVPFGAVVNGSQSSRVLVMQNFGDIGASFSWDLDQFNPNFLIEPSKGYSSPGTEVSFEITFRPKTVNQDIRTETICTIEGSNPLRLVLTGSCVPQTPLKEVIHFSTHVRSRDVRSIVLNNRSNLQWVLRPVIDNPYWTGADVITVEPQQSKNYELVYRPLVMTLEGKRHLGSAFFALPDGNGLLYNLTGVSEPPKAIASIQRDVPCKTNYTELLTVHNWLKRPQRFRAYIEMLKPDRLDSATTLKGVHYIDVSGQMKKDYKIDFYAHKEGLFSAKVIFKNEQTSEFLFYYVTFKATPPGIISTIDLSTPVRQSVSHLITLYNPLTTQVNLATASTLSDIQLPPNFTVPPQSEGSCTFDYVPLKSGEVAGRLTLSSSELGFYQYDLNLTATAAGPENQVHFRSYLGSFQNQTCRFINFCKSRVEYLCKVDNSDFHVERSITAASASSGGTEVSIEVTYEPSCLGNARATLLATSPIGGDYVFPLYGFAAPPKPQGPYTIKAGSSTSIPFKNVFPQSTQFTFHVDNPVFNVKPTETIRAKKLHNILVTFDGNQGNTKITRMGRLVVTCPSSSNALHNIEWVYYLKGVTL